MRSPKDWGFNSACFDFSKHTALHWCGLDCHVLRGLRLESTTTSDRPLCAMMLMGYGAFLISPDEIQKKVQQGNLLLQIACHFIQYCCQHNICWALENPCSSRVWLTSPLRELRQQAHLVEVHFCQYRQPWKKPTWLLSGPSAWLLPVQRTCNTQSGRCSATGRRHIRLVGTDATGVFMTVRAQPYPAALCQAIAASPFKCSSCNWLGEGGEALSSRAKGSLGQFQLQH